MVAWQAAIAYDGLMVSGSIADTSQLSIKDQNKTNKYYY